MAGLSPEDLEALTALPALDAQEANLRRQLEMATQLRNRQRPTYSGASGSFFGGLANVIDERQAVGQQQSLQAQLDALLKQRAPGETAGARLRAMTAQQGLEKGALDLSAGKQRMEVEKAEADRAARPATSLGAALLQRLSPGLPVEGALQSDVERAYGPAGAVASLGDARAERGLRREERAAGKEAAKGKAAADAEEGLRKEVMTNPVTKRALIVSTGMEKIRAAQADPSAAGDLALVFGLMKVLDPDSVVRESEQATAANARGVPDAVRATWNRVLGGERLTPAQRADFLKTAQMQAAAEAGQFQKLAGAYGNLAESMGVDRSRVVLPIGLEASAPSAAATGLSPEKQRRLEELRAKKAAGALR